jgi:hypothetical protein
VTTRRRSDRRGLRILGIGILILSTIRIPLPQADYHNIRHHDAPGEVCLYHDHLLRWHPTADSAADVSMLHWHWFVPLVEPGAQGPGGDDEHRAPGSGPALHAHLGDWPEPDWSGTPLVRPDARGRLIDLLALALTGSSPFATSAQAAEMNCGPGLLSAWPAGGAAVARATILTLLPRWNC